MQLVDGAYRCAWCGEVLDIPAEPQAEIVIRVANGTSDRPDTAAARA